MGKRKVPKNQQVVSGATEAGSTTSGKPEDGKGKNLKVLNLINFNSHDLPL